MQRTSQPCDQDDESCCEPAPHGTQNEDGGDGEKGRNEKNNERDSERRVGTYIGVEEGREEKADDQ